MSYTRCHQCCDPHFKKTHVTYNVQILDMFVIGGSNGVLETHPLHSFEKNVKCCQIIGFCPKHKEILRLPLFVHHTWEVFLLITKADAPHILIEFVLLLTAAYKNNRYPNKSWVISDSRANSKNIHIPVKTNALQSESTPFLCCEIPCYIYCVNWNKQFSRYKILLNSLNLINLSGMCV